MKKRWIILLMLLALLLTGCRGGESPKAEKLPLADAAAKALSDMDALVAYTADDLADILGVMPEDYTEAVFLVSSDALSGREAILVRAKDGSRLKSVRDALSNYLGQRMQETRTYLPDAYKLQSEARVETKNLTAALIVGPNAAEETRAFLAGE